MITWQRKRDAIENVFATKSFACVPIGCTFACHAGRPLYREGPQSSCTNYDLGSFGVYFVGTRLNRNVNLTLCIMYPRKFLVSEFLSRAGCQCLLVGPVGAGPRCSWIVWKEFLASVKRGEGVSEGRCSFFSGVLVPVPCPTGTGPSAILSSSPVNCV